MGLKVLLAASLGLIPLASAETVLGVYIFHRHGDRTSKEWPPTSLTPLGANQVLSSGNYYRNRYVAGNATAPIAKISHDLAVLSQMSVTAPVDTVLQNSAQVFLQGLYPPAGDASKQTLADGNVTEAPFGGYQYIPVNGVAGAATGSASEDNGWLQGTTGCANALVSSNSYFSSQEYLDTLSSTRDFYKNLLPVINGTFSESQANFKNGYTIYDLVHVSTIHNQTIPSSDLLTPDTLHQLQTRADQHEWGLAYNATDSIRGISGAVLAAQVVQFLNNTVATLAKASAPKLGIQFGAYGTFMSFFGHAQMPAANADFRGIVDYASSFALELVTNSSASPPAASDVSVRFLFSNGSAGAGAGGLTAYPMFGQSDTLLPWSRFADEMAKFAIGDTTDWCRACGNTTGICAGTDGAGSSSTSGGSSGGDGSSGSGVSTAVAGVIGALVTLVVILGVEGLVMAIVGLRVVKKGGAKATNGTG